MKFLPLHNPFPFQKEINGQTRHNVSNWSNDSLKFSLEELALFERRFQKGYDIVDNSKYNAWLQKFHPNQSNGNRDAPTCNSLCHCEKDMDGQDKDGKYEDSKDKDREDNSMRMLKPHKCSKEMTDDDYLMLCYPSALIQLCSQT